MSGQHSQLPPSGAPIWGHCAAAIHAVLFAPDIETSDNRVGTAAHWVGSECLTNDRDASEYLGETADNGVVIDEKMVEGASVYVEECRDLIAKYPNAQIAIEQRVAAPLLIHPNNWGTLDFALVDTQLKFIALVDYKHGHGKVSAFGNLQLANYLAGIVEAFNIPARDYHNWAVEFQVVQPFCFQRSAPKDSWRGSIFDVVLLWEQLAAKALEGMTDHPTAVPGAHCRYCPGRVSCEASDQYTSHLIDECSQEVDLHVLNSQDLAAMRQVLMSGETILKARLEAVTDELKFRISNGDSSSGLTLETVEGRKGFWKASDKVIIALAAQFGADIRSQKVVTPSQAKDLIPKEKLELWKKATQDLSYKKSSIQIVEAGSTLAGRTFGKK